MLTFSQRSVLIYIPTRPLKGFAPEITPVVTLIFRASLHQGTTPDDWKKANITPIFKKGDRNSRANFRSISLTSRCSKVMEHIIHIQNRQHLDTHKIISDQKCGFRKRRSFESQLQPTRYKLHLQDLPAALEQGVQIDAVLLDFSKAFASVSPSCWPSSCSSMASRATSSRGSGTSLLEGADDYSEKDRHPVLPRSPKVYSDPSYSYTRK